MAEFKDLYKLLATDFANVRDAILSSQTYANEALDRVVDVTSSDYTDAVNIEIALLGAVNSSKSSVVNVMNDTSSLVNAVRAINDYAISITTKGASDNSTLETFIKDAYDSSDMPSAWVELLLDAGYTVYNEWPVNTSDLATYDIGLNDAGTQFVKS